MLTSTEPRQPEVKRQERPDWEGAPGKDPREPLDIPLFSSLFKPKQKEKPIAESKKSSLTPQRT